MARNPTTRRLLISTLVLGLAAGACVATALAITGTRGASQGGRRDAKDGGTLSLGTSAFDYIDPALFVVPGSTPALVAWTVEDATCAKLLRYPAVPPSKRDYRLVPEVATALPTVSPDRKTYTFTIRKGYRFSTGRRVTAANYVHAIRRILNPVMHSPAFDYLREVATVKAAGNRLIVRLKKRVPDFPARMTMPYLCPVPTDLPIDPEGVKAPLPGSGPYYFAEFTRGKGAVLKRNRYYGGHQAHHVDRIVVKVVIDILEASRRVETDELDVDLAVPVPRLRALGKKYKVNGGRLFAVPALNAFYLRMNVEQPLFRNNLQLRKAVNFALDRRAMLSALGPRWVGAPTDDYLPTGVPGYTDGHVYPLERPNLTKAKALAHGHTRSGKAVMYTCNDVLTGCYESAQKVAASLKPIGIDVTIEQFASVENRTKQGTRGEPFDLALQPVLVPWVDPSLYIDPLLDGRTIRATGNTNLSYFNSHRYNKRIDNANALSGRARDAAYGRLAVDIARNAAPMAAAYVRNNRFLVSSRVGCVTVTPRGLNITGLCLD